MNWPELSEIFQQIKMPEGFSLEQLSKADVSSLTNLLVSWYPDIVVGAESRHLNNQFYYQDTYLAGGESNKAVLPIVARNAGAIVGFVSFQKNSESRVLTSPMGAISPDHRKSGASVMGWGLIEVLGRAMGAELLVAYVTLKFPHQQILAEKYGFKIVGIIPGNDRDMIRPGEVRRVYEAIFVKLLCESSLLSVPEMKAMTPKTQDLWNYLFQKS
jgi:hypothetical protein